MIQEFVQVLDTYWESKDIVSILEKVSSLKNFLSVYHTNLYVGYGFLKTTLSGKFILGRSERFHLHCFQLKTFI